MIGLHIWKIQENLVRYQYILMRQKPTALLYINNLLGDIMEESTPFIIATKRVKIWE